MNNKIPTLNTFEVENLSFKSYRDDEAKETRIKINRTIIIKEAKEEKKKFMVDITINGAIITEKIKDTKDIVPNYSLRTFSHFTSNEEIIDFTTKNEIIHFSILQAYVLTSKMFKDRMLDVGMSNDSIPTGIDFDI